MAWILIMDVAVLQLLLTRFQTDMIYMVVIWGLPE